MIDSYEQLFKLLSKDDLFQFGIKNTILVSNDYCTKEWLLLKEKIQNKESNLYIRSSGRNASGNGFISNLYKDIFGISIEFDKTNNSKPTSLLQKGTPYRKGKNIQNYQVSHVFGRTKNVYCFSAPWNIAFIPKVIDPFTGHEARGEYTKEFQYLFQKKIYSNFQNEILDYNNQMRKILPGIEKWLEKSGISKKVYDSVIKDFQVIPEFN